MHTTFSTVKTRPKDKAILFRVTYNSILWGISLSESSPLHKCRTKSFEPNAFARRQFISKSSNAFSVSPSPLRLIRSPTCFSTWKTGKDAPVRKATSFTSSTLSYQVLYIINSNPSHSSLGTHSSSRYIFLPLGLPITAPVEQNIRFIPKTPPSIRALYPQKGQNSI